MNIKELKEKYTPDSMCLCLECGGEYSSNPSDYFWATEDHQLTCCDAPLILARKQTSYIPL